MERYSPHDCACSLHCPYIRLWGLIVETRLWLNNVPSGGTGFADPPKGGVSMDRCHQGPAFLGEGVAKAKARG